MKAVREASLLPDQGGFNLFPATGIYSSSYCFSYATITDTSDHLPSGNPIGSSQKSYS